MLYLKAANFEDAEQEWEFVRQIPVDENGFGNSLHGISREDFIGKALGKMIDSAEGRNLREGYVPQTYLFLWKDQEIVGQFRIRHYLNEALRDGAGHIGYYIGKQFRGKGYGTEGLRLTLEVAKNLVQEEEYYLEVNQDNPASLHVMLHNGGTIHHEDGQHYYVRIPKD
ncbi:MAG: GNAT family N-acetyltransferase [Candidatus Merdivicinus sp.]|jgi:predicted acetyltransferase